MRRSLSARFGLIGAAHDYSGRDPSPDSSSSDLTHMRHPQAGSRVLAWGVTAGSQPVSQFRTCSMPSARRETGTESSNPPCSCEQSLRTGVFLFGINRGAGR